MGRVTHADTQRMMAYLLSRGSALPYRKDGLIMHLDAIQNTRGGHNASATTWEDLSGNLMDVVLYNATWGADYCSFTGADNSYGLGPKYTFASGGVTIEVVFSMAEQKARVGIAGWSYYGGPPVRPSIFVADAKPVCVVDEVGSGYRGMSNVALATTTYAAFSVTSARKNAVAYASTGLPSITGLTPNSVRLAQYGSPTDENQSEYGLNGRFMAVRVYDANLSAAELEAHWLIDKARFNIPD